MRFVILVVLAALGASELGAQLTPRERQRAMQILSTSVADIRDRYWDTSFGGLDLDALERTAKAEIESASSNAQAHGAIAKVFLALDDSHTYFLPPMYAGRTSLGWRAQFYGDSLYITEIPFKFDTLWRTPGAGPAPVDPSLPAIGDRIIAADGWPVERRRWPSYRYLVEDLQPRERVTLRVERGDTLLDLTVPTRYVAGRAFYDISMYGGGTDWGTFLREMARRRGGPLFDSELTSIDADVQYWKLATFVVSLDHIDEMLREAAGKRVLILDLRGNSGGLVTTALGLIARLAPADAVGDTVALVRERDRVVAQVIPRAPARARWSGRLIILVDAGSASASELVADIVQRRGWGTVLGDRTAGALTLGRFWSRRSTGPTSVFHGTGIAVGMIERPDGSRVERIGLDPDELIVPAREDLIHRRDPVLARAMQIAGLEYDPSAAWGRISVPEKVFFDQ